MWLYEGAPQWLIELMFTCAAAQEMFRKMGLVLFNLLAIDRSALRKTLGMEDIRTEVPPAEEQARENVRLPLVWNMRIWS